MTPPLYLVAFWQNRLLEHCEIVTDTVEIMDPNATVTERIPADLEDLVSIKVLRKNQINSKWSLCRLHVMAALLDPRQKYRLHRL